MKRDPLVHLEDVVDSCERIARYIKGNDQTAFAENDELQDAVVRRLEIIGEAVKRLPQDFRDQYPDVEWKDAAGMRDLLIHAYDEVDVGQVWRTVTTVLPD